MTLLPEWPEEGGAKQLLCIPCCDGPVSLWIREQPTSSNCSSQSHESLVKWLWCISEMFSLALPPVRWHQPPLVDPGSWQRTMGQPSFPPAGPSTSYRCEHSLPSPWTLASSAALHYTHPFMYTDCTASPERVASFFPSAGHSFHLPFQWSSSLPLCLPRNPINLLLCPLWWEG